MLRRNVVYSLLAVICSLGAGAQVTLTDTMSTIEVMPVTHISTVNNIANMSICRGRLCYVNSNMLFSAPLSREGLGNAGVDPFFTAIDADVNYVTTHPVTGAYYYTKRDKKGRSRLYRVTTGCKGRLRGHAVKIAHWKHTIVHPTFNTTGDLMVFSSNSPTGYGGFDLWCSQLQGEQWGHPVNLGQRINTSGNEFSPTLVGDFLFFSTNGDYTATGYDIYATRLVSTQNYFGDTIDMNPMGRSVVQRLPYPYNSSADDYGLVYDADNNRFYFVSRRADDVTDRLYGGQGRLEAVLYEGDVVSATGDRIPNVVIKLALAAEPQQVIYTLHGASRGHYRLFLQPDQTYVARFAAPGFLSNSITLNTARDNEEQLILVRQYDVDLLSYLPDVDYVYTAQTLFGATEGSDLTQNGRETLAPLARFLHENPDYTLTMTAVYCDRTNYAYCNMLNQSRLAIVRDFLKQQGVTADNIKEDQQSRPYYSEENTYTNHIVFQIAK